MPPSSTSTTLERVEAALHYIPAYDRDVWLRVGMAVKSVDDGDDGFLVWHAWSRTAPNYSLGACQGVWRSIEPTGGITIRTLFHEAQKNGFHLKDHVHSGHPTRTPEEIADRARREREAKAEKQHKEAEAATLAKAIWERAIPALETHAYLMNKGVRPCDGLRVNEEGSLLVPILIDGDITSLEFIAPDGDKKYLYGGKKQGGSYTIGALSRESSIIAMTEGLATAISVRDSTGWPTVICFDAGNLVHVAQRVRQQCPNTMIVICGDHDKRGTGQRKAKEAAQAINGLVAIPATVDTDWNDVCRHDGPETVKAQIEAVVKEKELPTMALKTAGGTTKKKTLESVAALAHDIDALQAEVKAMDTPDEATVVKLEQQAVGIMGALHTTIESLVIQGASQIMPSTEQPQPPPVNVKEPQAETPRLADVLDELDLLIRKFVLLPMAELAMLMAVWLVETYTFDHFRYCGYLALRSATPRCGKTLIMRLLSQLANGTPSITSMPTPAVLFRSTRPVLLLDEVDKLRNVDKEKYGEVLAVLNCGFEKGAVIERCNKKSLDVEQYLVYGPKVLAGIEGIADTLSDRSFQVQMERSAQRMPRLNLRKLDDLFVQLRAGLQGWADDYGGQIAETYDNLPDQVKCLEGFDDRFQDIAEPLIVLATLADSQRLEGPEILPRLLAGLQAAAGRREPSGREKQLLAFLGLVSKKLNGAKDQFVKSNDLVTECGKIEDLATIETPHRLAGFLKHFDLSPKSNGDERGYNLSQKWVEKWASRYPKPTP